MKPYDIISPRRNSVRANDHSTRGATMNESIARKYERTKKWKAAHREYVLAYQIEYNKKYYAKHREYINEHKKNYRITHHEQFIERDRKYHTTHQEQINKRGREYYATHREQRDKYRKKYAAANPEKSRKWYKIYHTRHPEKSSEYHTRRRAREVNAEGNGVTARQWEKIKEEYFQRCAYCNQEKPPQMDHIVPLSKGGKHDIDNIVPACKSCNSSKCDSSLLMFLYRRSQL